tara:strand:- start:1241 stop:1705 length:465 start_codon:yes stop_codon:yes gene_type:complete
MSNQKKVSRFIGMTFDTAGNATSSLGSIPFKVKEIKVISTCYDDGGNHSAEYYSLWSDLFGNTPMSLVSGSNGVAGNLSVSSPYGGGTIQFNPPRDIQGDINFRLADIAASASPVVLQNSTSKLALIVELTGGDYIPVMPVERGAIPLERKLMR